MVQTEKDKKINKFLEQCNQNKKGNYEKRINKFHNDYCSNKGKSLKEKKYTRKEFLKKSFVGLTITGLIFFGLNTWDSYFKYINSLIPLKENIEQTTISSPKPTPYLTDEPIMISTPQLTQNATNIPEQTPQITSKPTSIEEILQSTSKPDGFDIKPQTNLETFVYDGYTIVKNHPISSYELNSLKEILEPSSVTEKINSSDIEIPDILFRVKVKKSRKGEDSYDISLENIATAKVLNKEGFFLTASHVFGDCLSKSINKDFDRFMILYNPEHGFGLPAKILAYSNYQDILLGKVDLNGEFPIKSTKISSDFVQDEANLASYKYPEIALKFGRFFYDKLIIPKYGGSLKTFKDADGNPFYRIYLKKPLKLNKEEIESIYKLRNQPVFVNKVVAKDLPNCDEKGLYELYFTGMKRYYLQLHNSGSPVFNSKDGTILGTLFGKFLDGCQKGIYRGSQQIRKMINSYLNYHGNKEVSRSNFFRKD